MQSERVVLTRGEQVIVLRCTTHGAPKSYYRELRQEMTQLSADGFELFIEGVYGTKKIPNDSSADKRRVAILVKHVLATMKLSAKAAGMEFQLDALKYPKTARHADITFVEAVDWLYTKGLRVSWKFALFCASPFGSLYFKFLMTTAMHAKHAGQKFQVGNVQKYLLFPVNLFVIPDLRRFKHYHDMLLEYRNQVAVQTLEAYFSNKPKAKALVHYGSRHKSGLLRLWKGRGWVEESDSES